MTRVASHFNGWYEMTVRMRAFRYATCRNRKHFVHAVNGTLFVGDHHRRVSFQDELADIFSKAGIDYKPEFMMRGFVDVECRVPKGTPDMDVTITSH